MFKKIKGWENTLEIPEILKIKDGEKRSSGVPKELDYLKICNTKKSGNNFEQNKEAINIYKDTPKEIDITLMFDEIEKNFLHWFVAYSGDKIICEGNGEECYYYGMTGDKAPKKDSCLGGECLYADKRGCRPYGILNCQIKGLEEVGGCAKYRPKGFKKVKAILNSLKVIKTQTGGILAGIPLKLVIQPYADDYEKSDGSKGGTTHYFTHIKFAGTRKELMIEVLKEIQSRTEIKNQLKAIGDFDFNTQYDFNIIEDTKIQSDEIEFQNPALVEMMKKESEKVEKEIKNRPPKNKEEKEKKVEDKETKEILLQEIRKIADNLGVIKFKSFELFKKGNFEQLEIEQLIQLKESILKDKED